MRTSIKERKTNAKQWYQLLMNGYNSQSAIVIQRNDSTTNPNINRTQFLAINSIGTPVVIAESATLGIEGCFIELIESIMGGIVQLTYHEAGFKEWLEEKIKLKITYNDGFVIMLERQ